MTAPIPFVRDFDVVHGEAVTLSSRIRRVVAANPSAFTFRGTGTYIIGRGKVAVIDPGPDDPAHVAALLRAVAGETVTHIVLTHTHLDHSPAARALKAATGAPLVGCGPHGRHGLAGDEGADWDYVPDRQLAEGEGVAGPDWSLEAVHTPGHTSNHLCFALAEEQALFCGDHVMGWSTTIVSPPDGDMTAYMASLAKVGRRRERIYYPTHGAPVSEPAPYVAALVAHREEREAQIAAALAGGPRHIPELVATMYADVPVNLHRAAARSVLSHLLRMHDDGRVACDGATGADAVWRLP
ncbi:MAG: MBL fold metallo-hydrolase [Alphaproteobacteria bacterium]|nr:MBL fold metallo-hydrolase [Alphaproteobacteria bacterium]